MASIEQTIPAIAANGRSNGLVIMLTVLADAPVKAYYYGGNCII